MNQLPEKKKNMTGAWAGLILAGLYLISPLDIIPDVVPVVGWVDDFMVGAIGVLNFFQHQTKTANNTLSGMLKILKWVLIVVTVIAVLLILLFGAMIFSLFTK